MKKLIQEKQWAELKAYCLEKLLAGIENAEEIVDGLIEELAKKYEIEEAASWLDSKIQQDVFKALQEPRGYKLDDKGVIGYIVDKSSTDRYSEEQYKRRVKEACSADDIERRAGITDKDVQDFTDLLSKHYEEQHSKRLDEESEEIETDYFKKSVLYAVKNANEVSGVEQAYISELGDDDATISVNSHPGSNFSTIQVSRMLTTNCTCCNLISDNEPTRDKIHGRRQTVFKVYESA